MSDMSALFGFLRVVKRFFMSESFEGQVVDREGHPLANAHVYFNEICSTKSALSGRFSVELKAGTYSISVMYQDTRVDNIDRVVINGNTSELNQIQLDRSLFKASDSHLNPSSKSTLKPQVNDRSVDVTPHQPTSSDEDSGLISVEINGVRVSGKTVYELYHNTLTYLVEKGLMHDELIPWGTGTKRYLVAKTPVHPSGKDFVRACEVSGYYTECNKSRQAAPADMQRFIDALIRE